MVRLIWLYRNIVYESGVGCKEQIEHIMTSGLSVTEGFPTFRVESGVCNQV